MIFRPDMKDTEFNISTPEIDKAIAMLDNVLSDIKPERLTPEKFDIDISDIDKYCYTNLSRKGDE